MTTTRTITRAPAPLLRGTPVIIEDTDRPESKMVACLIGYDADKGVWRASYLSSSARLRTCWAEHRPTPIADFGVRAIICADQYRIVPTGLESIATYRNGEPREWQEITPSPLVRTRPDAFALLALHVERESMFNAHLRADAFKKSWR